MQTRSVTVALIGFGLLILDVLLPVPASLIMIVNGAIFGLCRDLSHLSKWRTLIAS